MKYHKKIFLDYSDMKYPLPQGLVKKLCNYIAELNLYPSGDYTSLKKKIANKVGVLIDQVLIGNGLDEIIDLVTRAFGTKVLIPTPTFSQFEIAAKRKNCNIILKNCLINDKYELTFEDDELKKSDLIWICNPNNPTGTKIEREQIIKVLNKAKGVVVVDECYYDFLKETVIDLINKYDNLIVLRSFSKGYGLAGARLGYALSNSELINKMESFRQIFSVNKIAEKAGELVLDYEDYYVKKRELIERIRDDFIINLRRIGIKVFDSFTNFVLIKLNDNNEMIELYDYLKKNNIIVLPAKDDEFTGLNGPYVRITIGLKEEMEFVFERIKEWKNKKK